MAAKAGEALQQYDASISAASAIDISAADAVLTRNTRGLYLGGAGDVVVQFVGDAGTVTLTAMSAGLWHPMQIQKVIKVGTTATGLVAGF